MALTSALCWPSAHRLLRHHEHQEDRDRVALVFIALPILLVLILFGFFYSVFYFPNWTSATTGTIISSGQKREYLLHVAKNSDPTKPAPLVITLHTSMSWDSAAMAISRWNPVAD